MKLAQVAGTVVSTIKESTFDDQRLLLCDYLSPDGSPSGGYVIAVDVVGAGVGEVVLVLDEGTGARQIMERTIAPVRALVVGIVDDVQSVDDR